MNGIQATIQSHPTVSTLVAAWIFCCIVGGMPDRRKYSSVWLYLFDWVYNTLHLLSVTIIKELQEKYPNSKAAEELAKESEHSPAAPSSS